MWERIEIYVKKQDQKQQVTQFRRANSGSQKESNLQKNPFPSKRLEFGLRAQIPKQDLEKHRLKLLRKKKAGCLYFVKRSNPIKQEDL